MMPGRTFVTAAVLAVALAACSDSGAPATAPSPPSTTAAPTTVPATTALPPTTTTSSSTTTTSQPAPTTSIDRIAEIEAMITDLELRRLDALYREDEEAFRALFASEGYLAESLQVLGLVEFEEAPVSVGIAVQQIIADLESCLAVRVSIDARQALGEQAVTETIIVLERTPDRSWGYSYEGTGWACDGPNPLGG